MNKVRTPLTIKRIVPPQATKKRSSIKDIINAAMKIRKAEEKEKEQYGGLGFA